MTGDRGDALRDSAALLRAVADRDREGVEILLDYSDLRELCEVLASLVLAGIRDGDGQVLDGLCAMLRDNDHQEDNPP